MLINKKLYMAAAAIILLVIVSNIIAFFTSSDSTTNRFSTVTPPDPVVRIGITENFEPPAEKTDEPFRKDVRITNTGTQSCYVRVRLEISDSAYADLAYYSADGSSFVKADAYTEELPEGWIYDSGYYYYTQPLPIGESTSSLLQWVKINFPEDSTVTADTFDIFVYAEGIEAQNSDGEDLTYTEAWEI